MKYLLLRCGIKSLNNHATEDLSFKGLQDTYIKGSHGTQILHAHFIQHHYQDLEIEVKIPTVKEHQHVLILITHNKVFTERVHNESVTR
jgi:hypothetical protein